MYRPCTYDIRLMTIPKNEILCVMSPSIHDYLDIICGESRFRPLFN